MESDIDKAIKAVYALKDGPLCLTEEEDKRKRIEINAYNQVISILYAIKRGAYEKQT